LLGKGEALAGREIKRHTVWDGPEKRGSTFRTSVTKGRKRGPTHHSDRKRAAHEEERKERVYHHFYEERGGKKLQASEEGKEGKNYRASKGL